MKRLLLGLAFFFVAGAPGFAQKTVSVELGVAPAPAHSLLTSWLILSGKRALAAEGKDVHSRQAFFPAYNASVTWSSHNAWAFALTGSLSWVGGTIVQYERFGTDPFGQPRYDRSRYQWEEPVDYPMYSVTFQARKFWNPSWKVQPYFAFGLGVVADNEFHIYPMPSLIPAGIQIGRGHFYGYAEVGFTPFASLLHGGLGYRF